MAVTKLPPIIKELAQSAEPVLSNTTNIDVARFTLKSQLSAIQSLAMGTLSVWPSSRISSSLWSLTILAILPMTSSARLLIWELPERNKMDDDLEAIQRNFLLRRFFKKKAKQEDKDND